MLVFAAVAATVGLGLQQGTGARGARAQQAPAPAPAPVAKPPLRIGYSDWPGWTAFEIGIQKGWFKEAGVDVKFDWFEYAPSMEAFAAGKVDAVMMTIGDALVTGAPGARSVAILITDYSNGNDMIVAKKGIGGIKALKGKKVGLETGPRRAPDADQGAGEERAQDQRRQAGQRPDAPDGADAGVRERRRDRRLAAERGSGAEGGGGLEGDLHQRRRARPDLRPRVREPAEPARSGAPTG